MSGTPTLLTPSRMRTVSLSAPPGQVAAWPNKNAPDQLDYWVNCAPEIGDGGGAAAMPIVAVSLAMVAGDASLVIVGDPIIQLGMVAWMLANGTPGATYQLLATIIFGLAGGPQRTVTRLISLTMTNTPAAAIAVAGVQASTFIADLAANVASVAAAVASAAAAQAAAATAATEAATAAANALAAANAVTAATTPATPTALGVVKVPTGSRLAVDGSGNLDLAVGADLTNADVTYAGAPVTLGTLATTVQGASSAASGAATAAANALAAATTPATHTALGVVKVPTGSRLAVDGSGNLDLAVGADLTNADVTYAGAPVTLGTLATTVQGASSAASGAATTAANALAAATTPATHTALGVVKVPTGSRIAIDGSGNLDVAVGADLTNADVLYGGSPVSLGTLGTTVQGAVSTASAAQSTASAASTAASTAGTQAAAALAAANTAETAASTPATPTALGVVKPTTGLAVAGDGTLSVRLASTTALGGVFAKTGSAVVIDGGGTIDIPDGKSVHFTTAVVPGRPVPNRADTTLGSAMGLRCLTEFGPIGDPVNGDDTTIAAFLLSEQNAAATFGAAVKGLCGGAYTPLGATIYLKKPIFITGSITWLFPGGKQAGRIELLNPQSMQQAIKIAVDGTNNNYYGSGFPKALVILDGIDVWCAGQNNIGLYGPDPADVTGVKQMACPWIYTNICSDQSMGNNGVIAITGPNGEAGPVCSALAPVGRHRIDFTSTTTFNVTLLSQAAPSGDTVTAGTIGTPLTITDGSSNTLCQLTITASVPVTAGEVAYFRNGCTAIYCTDGPVALKPEIQIRGPQIYSMPGGGIEVDPTWSGQLRLYPGGNIQNCGADALLLLTLYDSSMTNWQVSGNQFGLTTMRCATWKQLLSNVFANKRWNVSILGAGTVGPMYFGYTEADNCSYGPGFRINSSGNPVYLMPSNHNNGGKKVPNTQPDISIGSAVSTFGVIVGGSGFQSSASNKANQTALCTIGFDAITTIPQVSIAWQCSFQDSIPLWGQLLSGGGTTAYTGVTGGVSTPDVLYNPASLAHSPVVNTTTTSSTISSPSTAVALTSISGLVIGMTGVASGIPLNTVITAITPGVSPAGTITLAASVGLASGAAVAFWPVGQVVVTTTTTDCSAAPSITMPVASAAGLIVGMKLYANGAPGGTTTTIVAIAGNTLTLSNACGLGSGFAVGFLPNQVINLYGGINWGGAAPRGCMPTGMSANGKPLLVGLIQPNGNDAYCGVGIAGSKDQSTGPTIRAYNAFSPNDPYPLNLDGSGGMGPVLGPSGSPTTIGGALQFSTLGAGLIVSNGASPATVIAAPALETIAGSTVSTPLSYSPGTHLIGGTATSAVALTLAPMNSIVTHGALGQVFIVKDKDGNAGTNPITINAPGTTTIDGAASVSINVNYGALSIIADGVNFYVVS